MTGAVAIGGSMGGGDALREILAALPADFPCPLIVVLHRHPALRKGLAETMQPSVPLPIRDAEEKEALEPGTVFLAPAGYHLLVERDLTLSLCAGERVNYARPAVDVTFETAADAFGANLVGVILSGGNRDGAAGMARIKAAGGVTVVQDTETAEARAMPEAAIEAAGADHLLAPSEIGPRIVALAGGWAPAGLV